jgi:hypothetical protein
VTEKPVWHVVKDFAAKISVSKIIGVKRADALPNALGAFEGETERI